MADMVPVTGVSFEAAIVSAAIAFVVLVVLAIMGRKGKKK